MDKETDSSIRNSAQGVFMMMTNGFGATVGTLSAQQVINHFVYNSAFDSPIAVWKGWTTCWYIFAAYALLLALLFSILFKYKHKLV